MRIVCRAVVAAGMFFLAAAEAAPLPSGRSADLTKLFADGEQEAASRAQLLRELAALRDAGISPTTEARSLRAVLDAYSAIIVRFRRHAAWLHLRCARNRKAGSDCADEDALDNAVDAGTDRLKADLGAFPAQRLARLLADPALAPYRYAIADMRHGGMHKAAPAQEALLARLAPQIGGWQYDLYQDAIDRIAFGTVAGPDGPLDIVQQRNAIAVSPDAALREAGYRKRLAGYATARGDASFALAHIVSAGNALAGLHGFATAADEKYFDLGFDPLATRRLLDRLTADGALSKRFEMLRASELASRAPHPGPWDMRLPPAQVPPIAFADAPGIYHAVFAGLGKPYQDAFDSLIDPASGRFDIAFAPAAGRAGAGFSVSGGDAPSMLFVGSFSGTYKDLSVLAHEGGHAVHRELMRLHGVAPLYAEGPHFLFESFAIFNELLLADYLADHAPDAAMRRYYVEQFLSVKGLDYLAGADDALLEQAFYDAGKAGKSLAADDLDALTLRIDGQFSQWPEQVPELKSRWITLELAYEDPLYDVNYVYGGLLALAYYKAWKADPEGFDRAYLALLQNGFDDTSENLLAKFLHIDLNDDTALAASARAVVEQKFAILDALR